MQALLASEKAERLSHDGRTDHVLSSHSSKLGSHRDDLLARIDKASDLHGRNHDRLNYVINNLRADQDDLSGRLGDLSDARDAERASLSRRLSELQASLDNRFGEHDARIESLLSLHRSELDSALDGHRAAWDGHKGELDARL